MFPTSNFFFEIPVDILFSVIAHLIISRRKISRIIDHLNVWLALNVRVVYNSDGVWISIIVFQILTLDPKKHKKISVVFDEGLQILVYRIFSNRSRGFYLFFVFFSAVSIWGRLLFEGSFYLSQFSLGNSSDGTA